MTTGEKQFLKRIEQALAVRIANQPESIGYFNLAVEADKAYLLHRAVSFYINRREKLERRNETDD